MFGTRNYGFTIIEIVVVVTIISVLIAISIPSYSHAKMKAKETEVKGAVHSIQVSVQTYSVDHDMVAPKYLIGGEIPDEATNLQVSDPLLRGGYLSSYPRNPFVSNGASILTLQNDLNDPLRPEMESGGYAGYRFGMKGRVMGQLMGTTNILSYNVAEGGIAFQKSTYSEFDYIPRMCKMSPPWLAGQFVYSDGVIVGFGGWRTNADKYERTPGSRKGDPGSIELFMYNMRQRYPEFTGAGTIIIVDAGA